MTILNRIFSQMNPIACALTIATVFWELEMAESPSIYFLTILTLETTSILVFRQK